MYQAMINVDVLYRRETPNLLLIIAMVFLVPLIWWLVPGWNFSELLNQHDNLLSSYIVQREMGRAGGDWTKLLYWPQLAGGVKVHDIIGSLPFVQLLAWLGATPLIISNFVVFFMQILFAYFCTRITIGLSEVIYDNQVPTPYLALVLLGILFAFLPLLGWRLPYGHINIISGVFAFLCFTCLLLEEMTGRRSITSIALCALALGHTFQHSGYQMIHYSLVFGSPIILSLTLAYPGQPFLQRTRWYLLPALVFLGAFLISLPKFYGMLANALGDEMSRSAGTQVIYTFTIASLGDWISSLPWNVNFIPDNRPEFTHREVNYPLGPLVLLLLLVKPTTPFVRLSIGLVASFFMAIVVSMNINPFSTLMISVIPMLESFRVPARAMLPFLVFTSMLSLASLLKLLGTDQEALDRRGQNWLLAAVSLALFAINSPLLNDVLLILFILVLYTLVRINKLAKSLTVVMLSILTGAAVSAFMERTMPPLENPISEDSVSSIRAEVLQQAPKLAFPLNRVYSDIQLKGIGLNSMYFLNLSSLSSYWFPLRRYAQLRAALNNEHYNAALMAYHNHPGKPGFTELNRLYNVGWTMAMENDQPQVKNLDQTWGAAWISTQLIYQDSLNQLATSLKSRNNKKEMLLLASDPDTNAARQAAIPCRVITEPEFQKSRFPMQVSLNVTGQCWLTLAMNYSRILEVVDQNSKELSTFPAYGALLGIVLHEDTSRVSIRPIETRLPAAMLFTLAGFLTLIGGVILALKNPSPPPLRQSDIYADLWPQLPVVEAEPGLSSIFTSRLIYIQLAVLAISALLAYNQVREHHFVSDTIPFVLQNPWVHEINLANLMAMFTQAHLSNWQPLVWLSHSLDFYLLGNDSGKHHLVNIALHIGNAILIYFLTIMLMMRATRFSLPDKQWVAFLTSLIFAIHPQHVESVAWVVERKDVLYSLFFLSSILAYLHLHTRVLKETRTSVLPFLLFVLAIMSKPMAIVLPVILLLLDFYPLNRCKFTLPSIFGAVMEKWHYFIVAACIVLVTLTTQSTAMPSTLDLPVWARALNAVDNSWFYVAHYLVPIKLSPLYPYPDATTLTTVSFWLMGASFLTISLLIGVISWWRGYKWPLILVMFYIITLLPVSGLIHVGPAKATDHYTYLATLPLTFLTSLGIFLLYRNIPKLRVATTSVVLVYLLFLFLMTIQQVTYWNNPLTLWTRVVQLHPDSALGHRNLASAYYSIGEKSTALYHAEESIRLGGPAQGYIEQLRLEMSK